MSSFLEAIAWFGAGGLGAGTVPLAKALIGRLVAPKAAPPAAANITVNAAPESKPSDPPEASDRARRSAQARASGFPDTASFDRANSLGAMRCDNHALLAQTAEDTKVAVDSLRTSVSAAASAASVASAAAMRVEEQSQVRHEETLTAIKTLADSLGGIREWKGEVGARLNALEREMGSVRRGGSEAGQ